MKRQRLRLAFILCAFELIVSLHAFGDTASVVAAANTLISTSVASGANPSVQTSGYTLAIAEQWTNLPGGTRNGPTIGGGPVALSTDLSNSVPSGQSISPRAAAIALCQLALSDTGYNTMNEIRLADNVIRSTNNSQPWSFGNYHIAILGTPSTTSPWMLQISGHHLTYNITYNGPYVSATPMFIGIEPPDWYSLSDGRAVVVGKINGTTTYLVSYPANASSSTTQQTTDPGISSGTKHSALETQRAAVSNLAAAIQADSNVSSAAKLSGTFTDVVYGVTNNGDTNFPFHASTTYPTGTTGRGVLYSSLTTTEKSYVKALIEAYVNTQASDIATSLLADYESDAALNGTYIGYGVGQSGTALFTADVNNSYSSPPTTQHSYLRIDGPRVMIEFVVQLAVAYQNQNFVHYHSLWRDKLADYGNEFGGYLDTSSTSTTYTRPSVSGPSSTTVNSGDSTTLSVTATGTATLYYQWYQDGVAISAATSPSYTASNLTSSHTYYCVVSNSYGSVTSSTATVTVNGGNSTTPSSAVSRLYHSGTAYDISLPLTGTAGVECRSGGTNGVYQIVVDFPNAITLNSASLTSGNGTVASTSSGSTEIVVNITGVTNVQTIGVTLNVTAGSTTAAIVIPMSVLIGDANGDGSVNSADATMIRSNSGSSTDSSNFRSDINADGAINSADATIARSNSGLGLSMVVKAAKLSSVAERP